MRILFDARQLYFLTQYVPVYETLRQRGVESWFVGYYNRPDQQEAIGRAYEQSALPVVWFETREEGLQHYRKERPDWIVFGSQYGFLDRLPEQTRTAQLYHGIGMKSDVYDPGLMLFDVRFVEGPHYSRELAKRFPEAKTLDVGYAKVDPLFWHESRRATHFDLEAAGLNPGKPTVMYAPTHAPSSFPLMPDDFPGRLGDCNLIVKPHFLSFFGVKRRSHRRKMELWARASNCYVAPAEEYDPIPFMIRSDLLISEASSVLFEFAATGKPVVWCDFFWVHLARASRSLSVSPSTPHGLDGRSLPQCRCPCQARSRRGESRRGRAGETRSPRRAASLGHPRADRRAGRESVRADRRLLARRLVGP